jgi:hypothetical protein
VALMAMVVRGCELQKYSRGMSSEHTVAGVGGGLLRLDKRR